MPDMYLTGYTQAQARHMSRYLHRISRPEALATRDGDVTKYAVEVFRHQTRDEYALMIPDGYDIPCHPGVQMALGQSTNDVNSAYGTEIDVDEVGVIANRIRSNNRVRIDQLLTRKLTAKLIATDAARAAGWLPDIITETLP